MLAPNGAIPSRNGVWGRAREAEMFDLVDGREHNRGLVMDFLAGAVRLPVASAPHEVTFPDNGTGRAKPTAGAIAPSS